ncbi:MAG: hypothetical protein MUC50_12680 [Myxococcota bacterium]|nr:hypothetical protein [Myxococcota bacterium]
MKKTLMLARIAGWLALAALSFSTGCEEASSSTDVALNGAAPRGLWSGKADLTPAQSIAEYLKDTVQGITAQQMDAMMRGHYRTLRLLDENDNWALPRLAALEAELLPGDLDEAKTFEFVDHMAKAADKNEYLTDFLIQAQDEDFSEFLSKVDEEGDAVLPDAIAYAHALDRLNRAMRDDWRVLDDCKLYWKKIWDANDAYSYMDLFEIAKALSVEWPMGKFIEAQRAGYVAPDFMKGMLPINVMEAVAVDLSEGAPDNAYAGTILAKYPPGKSVYNPRTGEGPTTFSEDGKGILLNMALPGQWADLYTVWNLGFVTSYEHPYILAKLLIPSVNDYEHEPAEYIYNRGMALFVHIHFELMRRIDFTSSGGQEINWPMESIRHFWGKVNRDAANAYNAAVVKAKYPWMFWL